MASWRANLIDSDDGMWHILAESPRVAVLGIKPESKSDQPAYYVPKFLQEHGHEIIPVPVYFPDVKEILGEPVYRRVSDIPGEVDLVVVFRKPADIPQHVPDLLEKHPTAVWFQLGIRNDQAAEELARAGIQVVQDHCTMVETRRMEQQEPHPL